MFALNMAHPAYIRDKARQLRTERRLSLLEISERLALPKTTVYYWIRDLPDPEVKYRDSDARARARAKGNRAMQRKYAALRRQAYEQGRGEFTLLAAEPTFRDFVCMYIGEGFKRDRNVVSLANSDPAVVALADRWIRRLTRNRVTYALQYHADQDPTQLIGFWADSLAADRERFRVQRKSNSNSLSGRTWRCRYGVLTVACNDTQLRARLQGWIDCLREQWLHSPRGA